MRQSDISGKNQCIRKVEDHNQEKWRGEKVNRVRNGRRRIGMACAGLIRTQATKCLYNLLLRTYKPRRKESFHIIFGEQTVHVLRHRIPCEASAGYRFATMALTAC